MSKLITLKFQVTEIKETWDPFCKRRTWSMLLCVIRPTADVFPNLFPARIDHHEAPSSLCLTVDEQPKVQAGGVIVLQIAGVDGMTVGDAIGQLERGERQLTRPGER